MIQREQESSGCSDWSAVHWVHQEKWTVSSHFHRLNDSMYTTISAKGHLTKLRLWREQEQSEKKRKDDERKVRLHRSSSISIVQRTFIVHAFMYHSHSSTTETYKVVLTLLATFVLSPTSITIFHTLLPLSTTCQKQKRTIWRQTKGSTTCVKE